MKTAKILELQRKHDEQTMKSRTSDAKHRNNQKLMNSFVAELTRQMSFNTQSLFNCALNDNIKQPNEQHDASSE